MITTHPYIYIMFFIINLIGAGFVGWNIKNLWALFGLVLVIIGQTVINTP